MNIKTIIPHREPFLFVDGVVEMDETSIMAYKNIASSELYFQGHFPGNPVLPGVLMIEACAQAGAIVLLSQEAFKGKTAYLVGVDSVRFKKMAVPGDRLDMHVTLDRLKGPVGIASFKALVGGEVCVHGKLKFAVRD